MPIRKLPNGKYKWGGKGKEYSSRAGAERQAAAAHANGFQGKQKGGLVETPKKKTKPSKTKK